MDKVIDDFHGEYFFLDNFYPATVNYRDITFPTSEHAFQAMKSHSPRIWEFFGTLNSPGTAKLIGQKLYLRKDWEEVKFDYMKDIVTAKFEQHPDLAEKLIATGDAVLVEGNTWGDRTWGICNCEGKNWLGKILMDLRCRLKEEGYNVFHAVERAWWD